MDAITTLWGSDFSYTGSSIVAFFIFNLLFMLLGRFRFCFITSLFFLYYSLLFENRDVIERISSNFGDLGYFAMNIIMGVFFIGLAVWSFFIDSD